jgi:hypothetical protein
MLFKLNPVFQEIDLGIFGGGGGGSSKSNSLYDWLNEKDEEEE